MNARNLVGAVSIVGLLATSALAAGAQVVTPPYTAPVPYPHPVQAGSNFNLERIADRIQWQISFLNKDDRDYGGHRVTAIRDLRNAHTELKAAESYAWSHGYGTPGTNPGGVAGVKRSGQRVTEWRSDTSIANVRSRLQQMIGRLQSDSRDYGGHRAAAVNDMQAAVNELGAALSWAQAHPR